MALFQEFCGVGGLTSSMELESDMSKVTLRTVEILASCHALVYVDNKLVCRCHSLDKQYEVPFLGTYNNVSLVVCAFMALLFGCCRFAHGI